MSTAHIQAAAHVALSSLGAATSAFVTQSRAPTNVSEVSDRQSSPSLSSSAENSGASDKQVQAHTAALGRECTTADNNGSTSINGGSFSLARDASKRTETVIENTIVEIQNHNVDLYISTTADLVEFSSRIRESSNVLKRGATWLSNGSTAITVLPIAYEIISGKTTVPEGVMRLGFDLGTGQVSTAIGGGISVYLFSSVGLPLLVATPAGAAVGLGVNLAVQNAGQLTNRVLGEVNRRIVGPAHTWLERGIYSVYHVPYGP